VLLALIVPEIGLFISLLGGLTGTFISLVCPALAHLALCPSPWTMPFDFLTLLLAILGFLTSTYFSTGKIIAAFSDQTTVPY
jgi:proton-coupled amino acid transporter